MDCRVKPGNDERMGRGTTAKQLRLSLCPSGQGA
jgi:hypothetical protein